MTALSAALSGWLAVDLIHTVIVDVHLGTDSDPEWTVVIIQLGIAGHVKGSTSDDPCSHLACGSALNDSVEVVIGHSDLGATPGSQDKTGSRDDVLHVIPGS
jgi:hypothetical protein